MIANEALLVCPNIFVGESDKLSNMIHHFARSMCSAHCN